jgi:glucose/mannose transport system substrate-binding protein
MFFKLRRSLKMKKLVNLTILAVLLLTLVPVAVSAQEMVVCQEEVVVAKDDWLSNYADKYFGNVQSWPAIMALHNQAAQADPDKYPDSILNADVLEVGWTIQLVIGSWWTAGGEAEGLNGLFEVYEAGNPDVEIVNATVAGGAGFVFRSVVKPRILAGDPPDSFQLHAGLEVEGYEPEVFLEPLDDLYASEGLNEAFPEDLLTLLQYKGHVWGVPVNIHRSNVMWYDKSILEENGLTPPTTWDEFFAAADALQAQGIVPWVFGNKENWQAPHNFENILASTCGPEGYRSLWTGETSWSDACVTEALEIFKRMFEYVNEDYPALTNTDAVQYLVGDQGAMFIMGDWTNGLFQSIEYTDYGWAPVPGTQGVFVGLSDSFSLPKDAPNRENALAWLEVTGSKAGQEAFNPKKGSICARTDCDPTLFNEYLQSAMQDWQTNAIVPSVVHGAAAIDSWKVDFGEVVSFFVADGDVAAAQAALQQACVDAEVCQ